MNGAAVIMQYNCWRTAVFDYSPGSRTEYTLTTLMVLS